ncbi:unnamed protein product, partial [Mesorhabditis spiculigera]
MRQFVVLFAVISGCLACDAFPNGTDKAFVWWPSCGGPVVYYSAQISDANGKAEYPISLIAPLVITADADNQGHQYEAPNLRAAVNIWSWSNSGFNACKWVSVPTLGLLSDLDACDEGVPCPVKTGRQTLPMTMDFTKFDNIIKLLKDDSPYQLELQLHDKITGDKTCVTAQARCKTK